MSGGSETFRVDLRGIVGILSHHLYSSPRVYLRELLQNARDAVVAGRELDPQAPADIAIVIDPDDRAITVRDTGVGLTEDEMREVLATIGASRKREHLEATRRRFLGQFGIGLLSCFLIADRIEVRSRSARTDDAPTLVWEGRSDGSFTIAPADSPLGAPGTEVRVRARPDDRGWVGAERVRLLAEQFASLLDVPITISVGDGHGELISRRTPPWRQPTDDAEAWCRQEFGFYPLAVLPIDVSVAGVRGVAFVADTPGRVGNRRGDAVWSHGMFVDGRNTQLAPDWAYFVRMAVEAGDLPLTASREALQDVEALPDVREEIGVQIRAGIAEFARQDPAGFALFMRTHGKGLLAMAVTDRGILDLVVEHLLWDTSDGPLTLRTALSGYSSIRYTGSHTDFGTFRSLMAARGTLLIDGSYVYGTEILGLLSRDQGRARLLGRFDSDAVLSQLAEPDDAELSARLARGAAPILAELGAEWRLRSFEPATVPVLYLPGDEPADEDESEPDPWAAFLSDSAPAPKQPLAVFNALSETVRSLGEIDDPELLREAVIAVHTIGMLTAGEHLGPPQSAMLTRSLHSLLVAAAGNR